MIRIIKNYYVDVDALNYILKQETTIQKGKDAGKTDYKVLGYYGSLTQAIMALSRFEEKEIFSKGTWTLKQAVKEIEKNNRFYAKLIVTNIPSIEEVLKKEMEVKNEERLSKATDSAE